jgi:uncharacterized membrane protein (DUF106 family)
MAEGGGGGGGGSGGGGHTPARPQGGGSGMTWMFIMLAMMFILLSGGTRTLLGNAMGYAMNPVIGFGGIAPLWSIFLGSVIIVVLTQLIRHFMTDWVHLARDQKYMTAFNKELSEARKSGNAQRVQKLMELQPEIMSRQMEVQGATMKPTVFTMIFFIAFITWIYVFVAACAVRTISLPWEPAWPLMTGTWFPYSVVLYMLFSIVIGQMVVNILKYISFARKLRALGPQSDEEEASA